MKDRLNEVRDLLAAAIAEDAGLNLSRLIRADNILSLVILDCWDEDDVAMLALEPPDTNPVKPRIGGGNPPPMPLA